jgi:hypothetical protein
VSIPTDQEKLEPESADISPDKIYLNHQAGPYGVTQFTIARVFSGIVIGL